jgi:D-alanyl-D-alanine carboxypeptidase (penicillin-binding protein 5/6)
MRLLLAVALLLVAPAAAQAACPQITGAAAIVIDAKTGDVLCETNADDGRPIASTTKLMTALLVLERAKLSDVVTAEAYRGLAVESKLGLRAGEKMTVADLLRGLLIVSANDAAVTLAEHVSGSREAFVREMNRRAGELGLKGTRYANPIGLDAAGNYSTARELAELTRKLREFPFFRKVTDTQRTTLETGARPRTIVNRNQLIGRFGFVNGVKTGHTQGAGWVLVGSATRRRNTLISVVLGASGEGTRQSDTMRLLGYGFGRYRVATAVSRGDVFKQVPIRFRPGAELGLMASRTVRRSIRRGKGGFERKLLDVPEEVEGPIRKGQRLGTIEIFYGGERISRVPLVAAASVPEAGAARRAKEYFTRPTSLLLLGLALSASVMITWLRRRAGARGKARTDSRGVPAA